MHAVEAGVPLEASSIMVTIVTLDRAGRWALAEAVFTTAIVCVCDLTALVAMPLAEAMVLPGDETAASAAAAGARGDPAALRDADTHAAAARGDSSAGAGSSRRAAAAENTVGMLVAAPGPGLHNPRPEEDAVSAASLRALLSLRWRVLSHNDSGMPRSALLGLLRADALTLRGDADTPTAAAAGDTGGPAAVYRSAVDLASEATAAGAAADV